MWRCGRTRPRLDLMFGRRSVGAGGAREDGAQRGRPARARPHRCASLRVRYSQPPRQLLPRRSDRGRPATGVRDVEGDDLMGETYSIGEIAGLTGVTVETLRYYERRRLLKPPPRTGGGFRRYGSTLSRTWRSSNKPSRSACHSTRFSSWRPDFSSGVERAAGACTTCLRGRSRTLTSGCGTHCPATYGRAAP